MGTTKKLLLVILVIIGFTQCKVVRAQALRLEPLVPNTVPDHFIPDECDHLSGIFGYRMDVNTEKRLLRIDSATILAGFKHRPGSQTWIGEHVGKFLFSASNVYSYDHDIRIKHLMNDMVKKYIACQLPDGYLGTYLPKDYWTAWDVWAHKYAIIGLLNYYIATGYKPALEAAKRAANLICDTFGDDGKKKDLMTAGEHNGLAPGSILEPMVDLYRYTADPKYLSFCKYILRSYEQQDGPHIISTLKKSGKVTQIGDAKAYEMLSCFVGILKYYKLSGDTLYFKMMEKAWNDITTNRMYITGTCSDHEIFIGDGELKAENDNLMGEGCVTVTWMQFNFQLLQITGDVKYADELERSIYNHLLAAENPQTGCVSYYTALQGAKPYKCDQGYSCCLSSIPRGISLLPQMVAGKDDGVLSILMYEGGRMSDSIFTAAHKKIKIQVTAISKFPKTGTVLYAIHPFSTAKFALKFRVPFWSKNFVIKAGSQQYNGKNGHYLVIKRNWKLYDTIKVTFDMPFEIIPGGKSYPDNIAFKRGPQVMAVDHGLNKGIGALENLSYDEMCPIQGYAGKLSPAWQWKQSYTTNLNTNQHATKVILVPFAEAGQQSDELRVWIKKE